MIWNPGPSGMMVGALQITVVALALIARVHIEPAGTGWPRVRQRDGVRPSMAALLVLAALLGAMRGTGLDFWLIGEGRMIARGGDWYQERSLLQYLLLGLLALLYPVALLNLRHIQLRGPNARTGFGMAALMALIHVEVLRVVSLHAINSIMYTRIGPVALGVIAEVALALVAIACLLPAALSRFSTAPRGARR